MNLITNAEGNKDNQNGVKILSVRFTYLMEKSKDDLWFIGAENCTIQTPTPFQRERVKNKSKAEF